MTLKYAGTTDAILKAYYAVYNSLGYGFLEKVYENSLLLELQEQGVAVQSQVPISVSYRGKVVGEYFADLLVDNKVIVELKAAERLVEAHQLQLLNYLKATEFEVGLLLNFGKEPEFKRVVF